ncbi:MAG: tRNA lysidine(34) synthetase TilS [Candidatus Sericytochromatia bacterium]
MQVKNSVTNKIISFISQNNLFNNNDRILIAVSGGFDSTFLVDIIYNIQNLFKIDRIAIAHINYNLRGNDSINDKNFVIDLSKKYQFEIFTLDIDLKEYIKSNKIKDSLENIARNIRYEFFKDISLNNNFNKIVLAHNANDHAETILLKLIRGTVTGLKGIEVKKIFKGLELVRPILCISREDIEKYCITNKLYPRTDITNLKNDYTRNRIRNNILPLILRENPNFLESIYNSSIIFNREDKYLDK